MTIIAVQTHIVYDISWVQQLGHYNQFPQVIPTDTTESYGKSSLVGEDIRKLSQLKSGPCRQEFAALLVDA
jgi:hypothetical protein